MSCLKKRPVSSQKAHRGHKRHKEKSGFLIQGRFRFLFRVGSDFYSGSLSSEFLIQGRFRISIQSVPDFSFRLFFVPFVSSFVPFVYSVSEFLADHQPAHPPIHHPNPDTPELWAQNVRTVPR